MRDNDSKTVLLKPKNVDVLEQAMSARYTPLTTVFTADRNNLAELAGLAGVAVGASKEEIDKALEERFEIFSAEPEDAENLRQPYEAYKEEELAVPA